MRNDTSSICIKEDLSQFGFNQRLFNELIPLGVLSKPKFVVQSKMKLPAEIIFKTLKFCHKKLKTK